MTTSAFTFTRRARPLLEIGLGSTSTPQSTSLWDGAHWDNTVDAHWAGVEPAWVDVSCYGLSSHIDIGRARNADTFPVGRCDVIVDNTTGWADAPNDPFDPTDPSLSLRPGRQLRVGVEHATLGTRWLYRGYIDSIEPIYDAADGDTVMFRCVDALGEVGRAKQIALTAAVGASDNAAQRANRILNLVGWASQKRRLDPNGVPFVASVLEGQVVDLLGRCADSALGTLYADETATIVLRNQEWQSYLAGTPPDATIGNVDPGDVCPTAYTRAFDRSEIATRVILGRDMPPGTDPLPADRQYDNAVAQVYYGIEPVERTDLWTETNAHLDRIGNRLLTTRGPASMPRIAAVSLDAATGDDVVDLLTTLSIYKPSRYLARLTQPRGAVFAVESFATGIVHDIDSDSWTADISLDAAAPFEVSTAPAHWDDPDDGWDRAAWA